MNLFTGLLFQQGHIQDPKLALSLAGEDAEANASARREGDTPERAKSFESCLSLKRGALVALCATTALSPFR